MTSFVRGTAIKWTSTFTDTSGDLTSPAAANVRIVYYAAGEQIETDYSMTLNSGVGNFLWDSSVADAGDVEWYVSSSGKSLQVSASEGAFTLVANFANPGN